MAELLVGTVHQSGLRGGNHSSHAQRCLWESQRSGKVSGSQPEVLRLGTWISPETPFRPRLVRPAQGAQINSAKDLLGHGLDLSSLKLIAAIHNYHYRIALKWGSQGQWPVPSMPVILNRVENRNKPRKDPLQCTGLEPLGVARFI